MSRLLSSIRLRTSRFVQASEQMEHMPVAICVGLSSLLCGPGIGKEGWLFLLKSEPKSRHYTVFFLLKSSVVFWTRSGSINNSLEYEWDRVFDEWICLLFWMIFMLNDDFILIHMLWDTYVTALVFTMPKAHISDRGSNLSVPGRQHLFPLFFAFLWSLLLQQRSVLIWNASLPQKFLLSLSYEWTYTYLTVSCAYLGCGHISHVVKMHFIF